MGDEAQKATPGRIVHYRLPNGDYRPAIVVNVFGNQPEDQPQHVQLQVFLDGSNDRIAEANKSGEGAPAITEEEAARGLAWRTSVTEGEGVGQWTWPPRA